MKMTAIYNGIRELLRNPDRAYHRPSWPRLPLHDCDARKIVRELGWRSQDSFESGSRKTVQWYLGNEAWRQHVLSEVYELECIGL